MIFFCDGFIHRDEILGSEFFSSLKGKHPIFSDVPELVCMLLIVNGHFAPVPYAPFSRVIWCASNVIFLVLQATNQNKQAANITFLVLKQGAK